VLLAMKAVPAQPYSSDKHHAHLQIDLQAPSTDPVLHDSELEEAADEQQHADSEAPDVTDACARTASKPHRTIDTKQNKLKVNSKYVSYQKRIRVVRQLYLERWRQIAFVSGIVVSG
jgi:hypothetical protein